MNTTTTSPESPATTSDLITSAISSAERTKKWVAEKSGIPLSTFLRKLAGHTDWYVPELARVANVLGIHPATLLPTEFAVDDSTSDTLKSAA